MPRFSTKLYNQGAKTEQIDSGQNSYQMNENNLDSLPFYGNSDRYESSVANQYSANPDGSRWNDGSYLDYGREDYGESYGT